MTTPDPAVRSIQIATTLTERFGAILREAGANTEVATLELQIGEAQQLYPEIWRHLDDARTVLIGRGTDLAAFDAIRATQGASQLAVTDVDVEHGVNLAGLAFGSIGITQTKTASFDVDGYDRAIAACHELRQAMPDVDWQALARADQAQIDAVGSLTSSSWKGLAIGVAVAVGLLVAVLGIRALATSTAAEQTPKEQRRAAREERDRQAAKQDEEQEREAARQGEARRQKIVALSKALDATPCDRAKVQELRDLLAAEGQMSELVLLDQRSEAVCKPGSGSAEP